VQKSSIEQSLAGDDQQQALQHDSFDAGDVGESGELMSTGG
jgi:hypothetical protein